MTQDSRLKTQDSERTTNNELREELAGLRQRFEDLQGQHRQLNAAAAASARAERLAEERLTIIEQRLSYRLLAGIWEAQARLAPVNSPQGRAWMALTGAVRRALRRPLVVPELLYSEGTQRDTYEEWARRCAAIRFDRQAASRAMEAFVRRPIISIVMPVYNTPTKYLRKAVDSVLAQYYPHWELCICDDASSDPAIRPLLERYSRLDPRIKLDFAERNGGIVAASSAALGLATGEYIGLLDHDDELTPDALFEVVSALQETDADLIYSDEDKVDPQGRLDGPFFKPAWSPDLLLSVMYTCHFSVYRKEIVDRVGGFRAGLDGSQDYDLALRVTEQATAITHIPRVLYHWRLVPGSAAGDTEAKPYALVAAERALRDALVRRSIPGECITTGTPGFYRIRRDIAREGLVSVIIPMRDRIELLHQCLTSLESKTSYEKYEVIIVDNGSTSDAAREYLATTRHRVIRDEGPFNYARLNNRAVREAHGTYLLFLNNDTEVLSDEWMSAMVEQAQRAEVGAVGARLVYPDGRLQHAGVILGLGGPAAHDYAGCPIDRPAYFNLPNVIRNVSAVTAACLMMRRTVFDEVGGFDQEHLPISYNDVQLCVRLRLRGYLVVYTPYATLRHYESESRGVDPSWREASYLVSEHPADFRDDPYYNPNLSLTRADHVLDPGHLDTLDCVAYQPLWMDETEDITEQHTSGQEVLAVPEQFCAIAVKFSTLGRRLQGTVRLHVREAAASPTDLAMVEEDASFIVDNHFHTFYFGRLDLTNGAERVRSDRVYFFLEYENRGDGRLRAWKTTLPRPDLGRLFIDHRPGTGALTFRAYTHATGGRTTYESPVANRTSQFPKREPDQAAREVGR